MRKMSIGLVLCLALTNLMGCVSKKTHDDALAKLEARLATIEKMVLAPKEEDMRQKEAYVVPAGYSFVLGKTDAPRHIVVFSNFPCPHCSRADVSFRHIL